MNLDLILLALALAADAAIVGFSYGLLSNEEHHPHRIREGGILAILFGVFQFGMSYLGSLAGHYLTFAHFGPFSKWLIVIIFALLGLKMIKDSFSHEEKELSMEWHVLIGVAFATSLDALGAGVSFGTLPEAHWDCFVIGLVTFLSCCVAYASSSVFKHLSEAWTLRVAGVLMLFLSVKNIY
jgi:putative Mn2+ efflux pump MntP